MKELKKGDRMNQAIQKIKSLMASINNNQKLCHNCLILSEIEDIKKVLKDRLFDVSNEGEVTMDNLEVSFNKEDMRSALQKNGQNI